MGTCNSHRLDLGLDGAAYTLCLTTWTYASLLLGATVWRELANRGTEAQTWPGLTGACLRGWGTYLGYGLPAAAQICMEWWAFEVIVFMAGKLPMR